MRTNTDFAYSQPSEIKMRILRPRPQPRLDPDLTPHLDLSQARMQLR